MNSKNISILFISVMFIITATSLLMTFNDKRADFTPPPPDFESNQSKYNELIKKAQKAAQNEDNQVAYGLYKEALRYYPGNQGILNKMGILKLKLEEFKDAEKIYSDLCAKSPDQPIYKVSLAFSLLYQKKFKEAALVIDQARRLRSNDGRIHLISAAIKADSELAEEAVIDLKRYPIQKAIPAFLKQTFFNKIRESEAFKNYESSFANEEKKEDTAK